MINMLNEDFVEPKVMSYVARRGNLNEETEIRPITVSVAYEFSLVKLHKVRLQTLKCFFFFILF